MSTDDYLLDQVERAQRSQTLRRRENRSRRRGILLIGGLVFTATIVISAPSLISHSSIGPRILARAMEGYGWKAQVDSMRVGWTTPLRIVGLRAQGSAGSTVTLQQLDVDITAADLIGSALTDLGQLTVRGIDVACQMHDGGCSLEDDLALFLEPTAEGSSTTAAVKLQDIMVSVTDVVTGSTWKVSQTSADVDFAADRIQATFAGVLTEPTGSGGSLQGSAEYLPNSTAGNPSQQWRLELQSESLPLSVVSLLRRRFPNSAGSIPAQIHGDATGAVVLLGASDGAIEGSVRQLSVRNFTAADEGSRVWSNRLATLDGDLVLVGDRVIGRQLKATSDFASAMIDGAFSRNFSLVGVNDNPLRWLEAIDGKATIDADLAAFNQSLPGMLPLREEAELISGRLIARVDSTIQGTARRSELSINSDAIRARNQGRAVVIDPIEFVATVSSNGGPLRADRFEWNSAFGTAVGQGDLRSGNADVQVDFGRLTSMLRPIMHISESSLDGLVRGKIGWNASSNNTWKLSGEGSATNLVIMIPNGQTLRRPSMQGKIEAVGRWGGDSLQELTSADISLATSGLDLRAELIRPVSNPSTTVELPIRMVGQGRIDTLLETLGPWLPADIHDGAGSFQADARGSASTLAVRLSSARIELTDPKIAYADRYFSQPRTTIEFDGQYAWPSNDMLARTMTVASESFSLAAQGSVAALGHPANEKFDLQINWKARLESIQGSVRTNYATQPVSTIRPVGYRSNQRLQGLEIGNDQWLMTGDCEGSIDLQTRDRVLNVGTHVTGTQLAIIQPRAISEGFQTVGPVPQSYNFNQASPAKSPLQVVWSEPKIKMDGWIGYDRQTGKLAAEELQIAGDWFATTLQGSIVWNDRSGDVQLRGPARLKMNEVAARLTHLAGIEIAAEGVHETPLDIQVRRKQNGDVALSVKANVGWERTTIGGLTLGETSIPLVLSETTVDVLPISIPVGTHPDSMGKLNFAGQVHYRPGPLWMRLNRGSNAESIRLTHEMTDKWLMYLAPLAANTARIDGTIGIQLDEAVIVVDQPQQSRIIGRLNIAGIEMTSGPIANQIYGGIDQLKRLSRSISSGPTDLASNQTLITMPPQTVDFFVDRGIVQHNRMFFHVDRAEVITSGQVAMNGQLKLYAQIPLDERWLGSDLKGMANQPVTLPIDGTLSSPSLDSSGLRQVVSELATKAVEQSAENYIQKQLGRGMEKLFGR